MVVLSLDSAAVVAKVLVSPFEAVTVIIVPLSDSAAVAAKAVVLPFKAVVVPLLDSTAIAAKALVSPFEAVTVVIVTSSDSAAATKALTLVSGLDVVVSVVVIVLLCEAVQEPIVVGEAIVVVSLFKEAAWLLADRGLEIVAGLLE